MASAKDLRVAPIKAADANRLVQRLHYSGKVVPNSQVHLGVFLGDRLEGAMQFGPSMVKKGLIGLVEGTSWNGFIELNRMAFSDRLPRNSESRAIGVAMRLLRKTYPQLEWVVSFADGTQCGDGTIYRASGFALTGIKANDTLRINPETGQPMQAMAAFHLGKTRAFSSWRKLPGHQLRYVYFLNPAARERLTVPILPFSKIDEMGATMYRGERTRPKQATPGSPSEAAGQHRPGRSNSQPDAGQ
jgi:hypothetical protein